MPTQIENYNETQLSLIKSDETIHSFDVHYDYVRLSILDESNRFTGYQFFSNKEIWPSKSCLVPEDKFTIVLSISLITEVISVSQV